MLTIEADIYEYVRMSYVDKNILGPLVHMAYSYHKILFSSSVDTTFSFQTISYIRPYSSNFVWNECGATKYMQSVKKLLFNRYTEKDLKNRVNDK